MSPRRRGGENNNIQSVLSPWVQLPSLVTSDLQPDASSPSVLLLLLIRTQDPPHQIHKRVIRDAPRLRRVIVLWIVLQRPLGLKTHLPVVAVPDEVHLIMDWVHQLLTAAADGVGTVGGVVGVALGADEFAVVGVGGACESGWAGVDGTDEGTSTAGEAGGEGRGSEMFVFMRMMLLRKGGAFVVGHDHGACVGSSSGSKHGGLQQTFSHLLLYRLQYSRIRYQPQEERPGKR